MGEKNKEQKIKDGLSIGLLGITAVLVVVMVVRLMVLWTNPVIAAELLNTDAAASENAGDDKPSRNQEMAKALKEKNLFMPPSKPKQPPREVNGIFGKQALIGGKWYNVGDTVPPGAKILSIEATQVKLEWEGKEIVLAPIKAADSAEDRKPPREEEKKKSRPRKDDRPQAVQEKEEERPQESVETDELAWMGVDLPANVREKFLEKWNQMTDEQKEKAKESWSNMPDEQKQQAVDAMSRQL